MTPDRRDQLGDTFRWALEAALDPAMAAADWLARDIDASRQSAVELLTDDTVHVDDLIRAKEAFKTMRIVGETSADRRIGARLYAAAIASGFVHHGLRVSRQSDAAILRALRGLMDDKRMPPPLREMAGKALVELARGTVRDAAETSGPLDPPAAQPDIEFNDNGVDLSGETAWNIDLPPLEEDENDR